MNDGSDANVGTPQVAVVVTDSLNDKVIALICKLTDVDTVFTAFDVTKQIRIENPTMNVPHADVKEMVLQEWKDTFCDDYERTLTELTVGHSYVYHPDTVSALTHPLAVQPTAAPTSSTPAPNPVAADTDLTVEKRLNIPKWDLEKLGLVAGKQVRIDIDAAEGVISLTECTSSPYETLTVNADGRLRLNAKTLTEAFGSLPAKYSITRSADDMTIFVKAK